MDKKARKRLKIRWKKPEDRAKMITGEGLVKLVWKRENGLKQCCLERGYVYSIIGG
ncbi:MAG: hypothetical protein LUC90_11925 [Lachnospiraceae bacterium]|nr:hypothetical protein [Lachnospiraceae bacterium]